jgi:hypothetical protein
MRSPTHLEKLAKRLPVLGTALWLMAASTTWALPNPYPLQQQAAEAIVRDLGLDSDSSMVEQNLQVLAPSRSLPPGAAIHVVSARPGFTAGTWMLRLDCDSRRDCLPFHAILRMPKSAPAEAHLGEVHLAARGEVRTPSFEAVAAPKPLSAMLAHRGDQVELVAELPGVRLQTTVVCLDSGSRGDQIRVQNRDTHRIMTATVAGQDLVKVER